MQAADTPKANGDPGRAAEAFWRAPRRLRKLLEDGELTASAFALLLYLALAADERLNGKSDGYSTTYDGIAALLRTSKESATRALKSLRDTGLVSYHVRQGQRTPFRVYLTEAARVSTRDRTSVPDVSPKVVRDVAPELVPELTSEGTSAPGSCDPAPNQEETSVRTSTAAPETETESKTKTKSERRAARTRRASPRDDEAEGCGDVKVGVDAPPKSDRENPATTRIGPAIAESCLMCGASPVWNTSVGRLLCAACIEGKAA